MATVTRKQLIPSFLKPRRQSTPVEFARRALGGLGGLGGIQSPVDFTGMGQNIDRQYGEAARGLAAARRDISSGAWRDQAFGQHKPGDVILSDEERRKIFDASTSPWAALSQSNEAGRGAINAQKDMEQAFSDLMRDSGYANLFQGIEKGFSSPLEPIQRGMGAPGSGIGHTTKPFTMAGQIGIPDHLRPYFEAGMQQQGITPTTMDMTVHPNGFTRGEEHTFVQDPSFWMGVGGDAMNANNYTKAQREAAMNTMNIIGQGRAAMDPSFDWGGLNAAILDYNSANQYGPAMDNFMNAQRSLMSAFGQQEGMFNQAAQDRQQAATINQQAYDIMMNKGQQGGTIPSDFARPFYGQVTGVEGFGGQGTPWNPNQPLANAPGFGFGQTQNTGGFGFNGVQGGGLFGGGWGGGQAQNTRSDTPASDWGGVFNQRNAWSLS
jgi:hypothetical protein